ncbi:MAG: NAD(P)H-hydrate dehydratase [Cyanobacteriota bacterium]|nr:NAD(P)H-hydrate dehydratase [Cyanobacteriota bacterium]MDY6364743.1 NAD(P)H-hydrate dehydratase [Cyanobacteriota bacterium]MDY6383113.1 NAD(P)H-hydrate dehydratase [Cyanobacteriota bacterium]
MEFKLPQRIEESNKSTFGRVLNIAGSDYMSGAAYLSSVSALKIGCGYCFLCSTDRAIDAVAAKTSNVVFVPQNKVDNYIKTADVISIGCGLGTDKHAINMFSKVLDNASSDTPLVIDADGLNILAQDEYDQIYDLTTENFKKLVFTPHPKEASRLLGVTLDDVLSDIESSAKKITQKFNCVTVLKTHRTFICAPDGREYTNTTGNSAMAKAGSGDVLTGMITGLIAQKADVFEAACLGVYLHGLCGDLARKKLTSYSVMAEDLISFIPESLSALL